MPLPRGASAAPIAGVKRKDGRADRDGRPPSAEELERGLRKREEREERERKADARASLEGEAKRLQAGIAGSAVGLMFLLRLLFLIEAPWLSLPILGGAVYLWVRFYRRIKEIRVETERQGVKSDEIDTMAENAVMPFKATFLLIAVFGGVMLSAVLLVWLAKHLE
jgi:hypothetical protein